MASEWGQVEKKIAIIKDSDSDLFSDMLDSVKFETGSVSSMGAGSTFSRTRDDDGAFRSSGNMRKSTRSSIAGSGLVLMGLQSRQKSAVRIANLNLAPLEEKHSSTGKKRQSRRGSHFSQDPRKRGSVVVKEEPKEDIGRAFFTPLQLIKQATPKHEDSERNRIYLMMKQQTSMAANKARMRRQAANVHTVTVPKKGLIKLTGLPYEFDNPGYYDDRKTLIERLDEKKNWEAEMYGTALPPNTADLYKGDLIRNKSIIKQVKYGEMRLQAEQAELEERCQTEAATYSTFVGRLLEFEMPEVPTLNTSLQRFVGAPPPDSRAKHEPHTTKTSPSQPGRANRTSQPGQQLRRDQSRSAASLYKKPTTILTPRSFSSEQPDYYLQDVTTRSNQGSPCPLISPRLAFVTTEFLQDRISEDSRNKLRGTELTETINSPYARHWRPLHSGQRQDNKIRQGSTTAEYNDSEDYEDDENIVTGTTVEQSLRKVLEQNHRNTTRGDSRMMAKSILLPRLSPH